VPCEAGVQKVPESSLTLQVEESGFQGEWQVSLRGLDSALQLDANRDGEVRWPEIEHRRADIEAYLGAHVQIVVNGTPTRVGFKQLVYGMRKQEPFILARLTGEAGDRINTIGRQLLVAAGSMYSQSPVGGRRNAAGRDPGPQTAR